MIRFRLYFSALLAALLLLSVGVPSSQAQGQSATAAEIRQMLENRDQQIKSILSGSDSTYTAEQRTQLKELINGLIDFQVMSRQVLGPQWEGLSAEQRDEFVSVFRDVVRAQSMSDLGVYSSEVTYDQIEVHADSAFVRTTTRYQGRSTPVDYVLTRREDEWRAEDIIVDGVGTVEPYANSFRPVVNQRGFETLMNSLRKKRKEVMAKNKSEG